MRRFYPLLVLLSAVALIVPVGRNVRSSTGLHDGRSSPRFDGEAYVASEVGYVPQELDGTGVSAVVATLLTWRGDSATEAEIHERIAAGGFDYQLSEFTELASAYGFEGQWLQAEANALGRLKVPFVAHLRDGGGRFVIVRDARSGYVYATDPARGNVLYPQARFVEAWTGRAFAFPDPPEQPEAWR